MLKVIFKKDFVVDNRVVISKKHGHLFSYKDDGGFSVKTLDDKELSFNWFDLEKDGVCDVLSLWPQDDPYEIVGYLTGEFNDCSLSSRMSLQTGCLITKDKTSKQFYVQDIDDDGKVWGKWLTK